MTPRSNGKEVVTSLLNKFEMDDESREAREVAERYLPRELSQRIKIGFWTTAFQRMHVAPENLWQSFIPEFFQLSCRQTKHLYNEAGQNLTMRLLHLDAWANVYFRGEPADAVASKFRRYVTTKPERNWQTSVRVPYNLDAYDNER